MPVCCLSYAADEEAPLLPLRKPAPSRYREGAAWRRRRGQSPERGGHGSAILPRLSAYYSRCIGPHLENRHARNTYACTDMHVRARTHARYARMHA